MSRRDLSDETVPHVDDGEIDGEAATAKGSSFEFLRERNPKSKR